MTTSFLFIAFLSAHQAVIHGLMQSNYGLMQSNYDSFVKPKLSKNSQLWLNAGYGSWR